MNEKLRILGEGYYEKEWKKEWKISLKKKNEMWMMEIAAKK